VKSSFNARLTMKLHCANHHFIAGRCVSICGGPGVGKSALAIGVANYISERKTFNDGVRHLFKSNFLNNP